jgi:DNA-binding IscR family transcriptional regulator
VNTNPVVIRRLLARLAEAGLVSSTPGMAGGSRLARDPRRITLRDVFDAVETPSLFGRHSQQPNPKCPVGREVAGILGPRIAGAEEAALASLSKTTIAGLLQEVKKRER